MGFIKSGEQARWSGVMADHSGVNFSIATP